jgi:hypothetical protein
MFLNIKRRLYSSHILANQSYLIYSNYGKLLGTQCRYYSSNNNDDDYNDNFVDQDSDLESAKDDDMTDVGEMKEKIDHYRDALEDYRVDRSRVNELQGIAGKAHKGEKVTDQDHSR